jgi:hypothetical protein
MYADKGEHTDLPINNRRFESPICGYLFNVARKIGQNFQRQIAQRFIRSLNRLPWIRHCDTQAQVIAHPLPRRHFWLQAVSFLVRSLGIRIQMPNKTREIGIMSERFEAEFVFEGDGESEDEIYGCDFCEEIIFCVFRALGDVNPEVAGEVTGLHRKGGPRLAAVGVTVLISISPVP